MIKRLLLALSLALLPASAFATICPSVPYSFSPGTTIQSGQVNSNFTTLLGCFNSGGIATAGANTNITSVALTSGTAGAFTVSGTFTGANGTLSADWLWTGTGEIQLPSGTTAQRSGSPAAGMLRYNNQTGSFEGYTTVWNSLAASTTPPGGRLSTVSTSWLSTGSASGVTSLYYVPYISSSAPYYNGASWLNAALSTVTDTLSSAAYSPAAVTTSTVYDEFLFQDAGGVFRLSHVAWTNATTRNIAVTNTNGFLTNATNITGTCSTLCPSAGYGLYLGTFYSDSGSATITFNPQPAAASGGALAVVDLWNFYNPVPILAASQDSKSTWTYATPTFGNLDGSATNRINFVSGIANYGPTFQGFQNTTSGAAADTSGFGIGIDSSSTATVVGYANYNSTNGNVVSFPPTPTGALLGFHYIQALQVSPNSVTVTYYGSTTFGLSGQSEMLSANLAY